MGAKRRLLSRLTTTPRVKFFPPRNGRRDRGETIGIFFEGEPVAAALLDGKPRRDTDGRRKAVGCRSRVPHDHAGARVEAEREQLAGTVEQRLARSRGNNAAAKFCVEQAR